MNSIFIGEHLVPGRLGHFFIILSFAASLFSGFCFFRAAKTEVSDPAASRAWLRIARNSFVLHTAGIIGIFFTLYYVITHHLFEYNYAWQHSNLALPTKYLLSCFWEGQEGSFMLWAFWHSVLGCVLMGTAKSLESRAMTVVSGVQVCITSMLLGAYLTAEVRVGSTPFLLLRHAMKGAPIFTDPNYLGNFIKDGNGLNVLLQNYWMVIHPPVLFLGFASTLVPFSLIIAALWKGEYKRFIRPTVIASLFSGGVLGLGIMMGGAWAYESLNFGGYWAWDPVENASLVPWLTLIAGLHTLIVFKATGRSLAVTMVLFCLTYVFIWYSTFLTRTGVLGDTSVHAFTGEGKSLYWHLLVVIGLLLTLVTSLLIARWKSFPRIITEEAVWSREFWMAIGSFVLLLSAGHIILVTSIPVWSPLYKFFTGVAKAPPINREAHYNSVQVWVAILLALLSAAGLFMKFKNSDRKVLLKRYGILAAIAGVLSLFIGWARSITTPQYCILLFAAVFALCANVYYAFGIQRGSLLKRGAALTHFGFALTLLGILLSSYGKEVISLNTTGAMIDMGKKTAEENIKESQENVILFRGARVAMGKYFVTYLGDSASASDPRTFFRVRFEDYDTTNPAHPRETFMLYPDAFVNPKGQQGLSSNPSTRHYLTRDIFTYVNSVYKATDKGLYKTDTVKQGDSIFFTNGYVRFEGFDMKAQNAAYMPMDSDVAIGARLSVHSLEGGLSELHPLFIVRKGGILGVADTAKSLGLFARFVNVIPQQNAAVIETKVRDAKDEYIVLKALVFPYINVLWTGVLLMVAGFMLSMINRIRKKEAKVAEAKTEL